MTGLLLHHEAGLTHALAHNRRDGAMTKAEVLLNLGREDLFDTDGLRRLVGSICR